MSNLYRQTLAFIGADALPPALIGMLEDRGYELVSHDIAFNWVHESITDADWIDVEEFREFLDDMPPTWSLIRHHLDADGYVDSDLTIYRDRREFNAISFRDEIERLEEI